MKEYLLRLSPAAALEKIQQDGAFLLDVRSPFEFAAAHASHAVNIPVTGLAARAGEIPRDRPILAMCLSGHRSQIAAQTLRRLGFIRVGDIEGGLKAWQAAGLPTVVTRRGLSLDEQFRLLIGLFVLTFTLLGAFVSPWFLLGSGFIGFMLALTALLGICPMLDLLGKLPWNRS